MASSLGSRMAYNKAVEAINRAGFSAGQAVLSQGYLRTEQTLISGKTLYSFPILQNDSSQGTINSTEQRLALQDAFYVSSVGVFLAASNSAAAIPQTYNDPLTFTGSGDAAALGTVYNSWLSITTNNRQIVPSYDLSRHYMVPQTQASTNGYFATGTAQKNQVNLSSDGFYPIEPGWVIVGSKNNQIQITLPAGMTFTTNNTYRLILVFRGHNAQNVTPVR
jgi:hypothetical protein